MGARDVQRPEVGVEGLIHELVVNVEEVGFRMRLWRFLRTDPVELVCKPNTVEGGKEYVPLMTSTAGQSSEDANIQLI